MSNLIFLILLLVSCDQFKEGSLRENKMPAPKNEKATKIRTKCNELVKYGKKLFKVKVYLNNKFSQNLVAFKITKAKLCPSFYAREEKWKAKVEVYLKDQSKFSCEINPKTHIIENCH